MRREAKPCQKGYFKLEDPESSGNTRGTREGAVTKSTDGDFCDIGSLCLGTVLPRTTPFISSYKN